MVYLPSWTHCGIFGSTGTGKSTLAELLCEIEYMNNGSKIVDLTNNRYLEAAAFMRPTRKKSFRQNILRESGGKVKPKGFPTEIYHPIIAFLPEKFPPSIKLYSLPLEFFAYEEVLRVLTNDSLGDASYVALTQEIEKLSKTDSLPAVPSRILETISRKILKTYGLGVPMYFYFDTGSSASAANRPILKVKNVGIFSSTNFEYTLTDGKIEEILRDRKTITGFGTRFIEQKYRKLKLAVNLFLITKIRDIAKRSGGEIILYIREARELFPSPRVSDKGLKVLAEQAEDLVKDCRKSGIKLILDTQTPWDLPEGVLDQLSLRFIFRHDRRESDILDMYAGSPSLDRERIKHIKRLRNFYFYMSGPNVPLAVNKFTGITLDFKLSDHLEEKEDELNFIKGVESKKTWYETKPVIKGLKEDWMDTYNKYKGKFERLHVEDLEKVKARSMGIAVSDMRILKYLFIKRAKQPIKFKELQTNTGMPKATCQDSINRMEYKGFVKRDKKSRVSFSETGLKFVQENQKHFEIAKLIGDSSFVSSTEPASE